MVMMRGRLACRGLLIGKIIDLGKHSHGIDMGNGYMVYGVCGAFECAFRRYVL
jgi:hypothetical protein